MVTYTLSAGSWNAGDARGSPFTFGADGTELAGVTLGSLNARRATSARGALEPIGRLKNQ